MLIKTIIKVVMVLVLSISILVSYASTTLNFDKDIQRIIDKNRRVHHLVGVQVSIFLSGERSPRDFVSGNTTVDLTTRLSPHHLFQIGSETKSFISTILLQLEEEGALSIDEPISNWIPGLIPNWQYITIKQLLNHTSGIHSYTELEEFWYLEQTSDFQQAWSVFDLVNLVEDIPLAFNPGEGWHYSDTNYILAGMIITAVTGKSVEEELKTRFFQPLRLNNTHYILSSPSEDLVAQMAHGYDEKIYETPFDATYVNLSMADAAGALISTSHDTAIWLKKLLTTNSVLSAKQRGKMMSVVDYSGQSVSGPGSGLGIFLDYSQQGEEIWSHRGGTPGYLSSMLWLKSKDIVITTLINTNNNQASEQLWNDLINYMHKIT